MTRHISIIGLLFFTTLLVSSNRTRAQISNPSHDFLKPSYDLDTKSFFTERLETQTSIIPFEFEYRDDRDSEVGVDKTLERGENGLEIKVFRVYFWQGQEYHRILDHEKIRPPKNERIQRGTKVVWRELATPDHGPISYWKKINVRATSYDAHCLGCTGRTYTGTEVRIGTCAVDPKVIQLGTSFYVPGYGTCRAEDIGGAIKGNKIDLGFPEVSRGWWSTRYVDIYLIDGDPKD